MLAYNFIIYGKLTVLFIYFFLLSIHDAYSEDKINNECYIQSKDIMQQQSQSYQFQNAIFLKLFINM